MEGNRKYFLNKHSNPQFKRKDHRRGKQRNSFHEESSENSQSSDTVYRILCQSKKIGSVIGKGGNIVKALREETQAKITVSDSVPGSDERVIILSSPSNKQAKRQSSNNGEKAEKGDDAMELHCAAQDALLKVHDRIVEEDLGGAKDGNEDDPVVTVRLLVSNNTVGCLLGRKGDVIQRLRSETGANIRVLPADDLPACAMSNDVLVQISSKPAIAKRALYEASTLLHQNPRKDKPPSSFPTPNVSQRFHPLGPPERNMLPGRNPAWLEDTPDAHNMPPMPWRGAYGIHQSRFEPEDFDGLPPPRDHEVRSEYTMKILCSAEKIGGVIGKGGLNVRQLEQETGASIHVDNALTESEERVIRVSSYEVLSEQVSRTINAILQLQNKTCEFSEKGTITTRLLVPSSKVGCILGQGGHVINEMRRTTRADIRVFSKEDKPNCASEDEELVQISGSFGVVRDALVEIASRLRTRCLRDANSIDEPAPVRPVPRFGPEGNLGGVGLPPFSAVKAGSSGRYEQFKGGGREYEPPSLPFYPHATGYSNVNEAMISPVSTMGGNRISEFAGERANPQDPYSTRPEFGTTEHFNASGNMYQTPASSGGPNSHPGPALYQAYNSQPGPYPNTNSSTVPYQNYNPQPDPYPNTNASPGPYQNYNPQPVAQQNNYTQQGSYRY